MQVKFPNVKVKLTGGDGNAFAVISAVKRALKNAGLKDEARPSRRRPSPARATMPCSSCA